MPRFDDWIEAKAEGCKPAEFEDVCEDRRSPAIVLLEEGGGRVHVAVHADGGLKFNFMRWEDGWGLAAVGEEANLGRRLDEVLSLTDEAEFVCLQHISVVSFVLFFRGWLVQVLCTGEFSGALGSEGTDAALREYFRVSQGGTLPRPSYNALKNKKKYRAALLHRCVAASSWRSRDLHSPLDVFGSEW